MLREPSSPLAISPAHSSAAETHPVSAFMRGRAVIVRARRRQQVAFTAGRNEAVFIVRSGMLVLQMSAPGKHRQLLSVLYPHDVFRAAFAPPLPGLALTAVSAAELWRMPAAAFETEITRDLDAGPQLNRQLADQHGRSILHCAMIGGLSGEERAASFLLELALRIGNPSANGAAFEIPLSRTDVADYLSLNADTLSRIMSRLKGRGLVAQTGRDRIVIPDLEALSDLSPIADTLQALHGAGAAAHSGR
jgi:CRP/FNR family transcriptional regulator, anaerobic regulatory protein